MLGPKKIILGLTEVLNARPKEKFVLGLAKVIFNRPQANLLWDLVFIARPN